ncbi:MAG: nuclear transport factor 2 family protein [Blastocatellia bacterium]
MPGADSHIEHDLRRMNADWVSALIARDTAELGRIMARDCSFTYPLEGDSTDQFIADIQSGDLTVQSMIRDNVEVRIFGQTAILTSLDNAKWIYKGHIIEGYYRSIHVYAERDGRWQLVAIQACPIAQ